jgi:hypothetical protein
MAAAAAASLIILLTSANAAVVAYDHPGFLKVEVMRGALASDQGVARSNVGVGNLNEPGFSSFAPHIVGADFEYRFNTLVPAAFFNRSDAPDPRSGASNLAPLDEMPEVPVPGAGWLMGSAIAGLAFAATRRKRTGR